MRVALDLTPAAVGEGGVARYARELADALEAEGVDVLRFTVGRLGVAGARRIPLPLRLVQPAWSRVALPRVEWFVPGADVVHTTDMAAAGTALPLVCTVHDLDALAHPGLHPAHAVAQQRRQVRSLRRASVVCADSRRTADAVAATGFDPDRIVVAPLGHRPLPPPTAPAAALPGRFVLAVGEAHHRKGLDVLLRALAAEPTGLELVHAGAAGPASAELHDLAAALGVAGRVRCLGRVTDAELAHLLSRAVALCFPSRAEGFGLPVLEAMAAGCPVLASDLPAVRDVGGDAVMLVAGDDPAAWAASIGALAADEARRAELANAGRLRSAGQTWQATARATVAAYEMARC